MKLGSIEDFYSVNPPASEQAIADVELAMGMSLPDEMRDLLLAADGFRLDNGVGIYGTDEIEERNATFEVGKYAPGYLAIGDDSGGRAVMLRFGNAGVYWVHQGIMAPEKMTLAAHSLQEWVDGKCPM